MPRLQPRRTCGTCGHDKSAHTYDPDGHKAPPARCSVPGCACGSYRQMARGERCPRS